MKESLIADEEVGGQWQHHDTKTTPLISHQTKPNLLGPFGVQCVM